MIHLIWALLHVVFYLYVPDYGASISLFIYVVFELAMVYGKRQKLELIHFYFIGLIISLFANMSIIFSFLNGKGVGSFIYANPQYFASAALVFALGNQFLAMGYLSNLPISLPKIKSTVLLSVSTMDWIFVISMFIAFKNFWMTFTLPGTFQIIIDITAIVGIFMLSRFAGKYGETRLFIQALILTVSVAFNALLFSYLRLDIISPVIVFVLGYYVGTGKAISFLNVKFLPLLILMLIFYSFFELFGASRQNISSGFNRLSELNTAILDKRYFGFDEEEKLTAFERSSNISQLSAVYGLVANHGFYKGNASLPLLVALVPRFLWPEKPLIGLGAWFAMEIGAAEQIDDWYNNAVNMTIPGHLFLDFGWWGLAIGSFLVGLFLKILWSSVGFYEKKFNLLGTFFGVYLLFTCFLGIGADLQIIITYFSIYLVVLVISKIFNNLYENSLRRANLER